MEIWVSQWIKTGCVKQQEGKRDRKNLYAVVKKGKMKDSTWKHQLFISADVQSTLLARVKNGKYNVYLQGASIWFNLCSDRPAVDSLSPQVEAVCMEHLVWSKELLSFQK